MKRHTSSVLTAKDIALIGMMVAVIEVCKVAFAALPNIELTSFWVILFSLYFGKKTCFVIPVFILLEGVMYGFGLWWVMYLYAWPLLAFLTRRLRHMTSPLGWAVLSGLFGLLFGFLCAIPYFFLGLAQGGIANGLRTAFTWWIAGIPWDIIHGVSNFILMLVLYHPMTSVMKRIQDFHPIV